MLTFGGGGGGGCSCSIFILYEILRLITFAIIAKVARYMLFFCGNVKDILIIYRLS